MSTDADPSTAGIFYQHMLHRTITSFFVNSTRDVAAESISKSDKCARQLLCKEFRPAVSYSFDDPELMIYN